MLSVSPFSQEKLSMHCSDNGGSEAPLVLGKLKPGTLGELRLMSAAQVSVGVEDPGQLPGEPWEGLWRTPPLLY